MKSFYIGGTVGGMDGMSSKDNLKDIEDICHNVHNKLYPLHGPPWLTTNLFDPKSFCGLEIGYELPLIRENQLLGVRFGYNWHEDMYLVVKTVYSSIPTEVNSRLTLKEVSSEWTLENVMQSIPVTVYYKYEFKKTKFSVLGGVGLTFVEMKVIQTNEQKNLDDKQEERIYRSGSKASPHIAGGLEYRFSKLLGLSFDLKYTINSETKWEIYGTDYVFKRELGFQGAFTIRFYAF
ncbi:MAG: porin family protein [Endomicrobium sp.]|nr:porin family protein [Endomicrobium sp.]